MIFCCENCHFLFVHDRCEKQCPDCGKFAVRAANQGDRAEYKRLFSLPTQETTGFFPVRIMPPESRYYSTPVFNFCKVKLLKSANFI